MFESELFYFMITILSVLIILLSWVEFKDHREKKRKSNICDNCLIDFSGGEVGTK